MGRKKHEREEQNLERLERENRELKSLVRSLMKRIKKLSKGYRKYLNEESAEELTEKPEEKMCFNCERGILEVKMVLSRRWRECSICEKRTTMKYLQEDGTWKKQQK